MFFKYLRSKIKTIFTLISMMVIFTMVARLSGMLWENCIYADAICLFFCVTMMLYDFYRYAQKVNILKEEKMRVATLSAQLPKPTDGIEEEYREIINILTEQISEITSKVDIAKSDMTDYYTMWVHQIKIPIAAMGLLLQTEEFEGKSEMQLELFKIQQYVEMVLQYLRLGSEQTDFLFKKYNLDDIIKECIKKYSVVFIKKKIGLKYEPVNSVVISDEKWLSFVIEQVLSNALKYTKRGFVSVYMDEETNGTLVIEDTGIGIQEEDIPRVFDRGYTGYNGRTDKKSTGIGLYLCDRILKKLGHSMKIESEVGVGTKVKIDLSYKKMKFE